MALKVRDVKKALELVPDDAEMVILDDDYGELSLFGPGEQASYFAYFDAQRCCAFFAIPEQPLDDEEVDREDPVEADTEQLSKSIVVFNHPPEIVEGEFSVIPEEAGDPTSTVEPFLVKPL